MKRTRSVFVSCVLGTEEEIEQADATIHLGTGPEKNGLVVTHKILSPVRLRTSPQNEVKFTRRTCSICHTVPTHALIPRPRHRPKHRHKHRHKESTTPLPCPSPISIPKRSNPAASAERGRACGSEIAERNGRRDERESGTRGLVVYEPYGTQREGCRVEAGLALSFRARALVFRFSF